MSATDALKTASKRAIQKTTERAGDLTGNKIAKKITKISPQNTSEIVGSETENTKKKRYISPEENRKLLMNEDYYNNIIMAYQIMAMKR